MTDYRKLHNEVYGQRRFFDVDRPLPADPFTVVASGVRPNSIAIQGGAFGDEGKGRVVDELCVMLCKRTGRGGVIYRWNGGANAGHTVVVDGQKIALHQLPAGVLMPGTSVVLGKGMVIHPGDVLAELRDVHNLTGHMPGGLYVDEMAVLALDTHRAMEITLKRWESGGHGATGRGISPAYADVLYRHPIRMRDLAADDWQERLSQHYDLYAAQIDGLDGNLAEQPVPRLDGNTVPVGSKFVFLDRLAAQRAILLPYIGSVHDFLHEQWTNPDVPFIFEGAQGAGLDPRFGVYPDVTSSDPTFGGILHSTEGLVKPGQIAVRAATIKATYTSSVGTRRLPTMMPDPLASRIREEANEYGATTRRPRDIAYIDLPCLGFLSRVTDVTHLVLTHLDIAYPEVPIRVCASYADDASYRPDQDYLDTVTPEYLELPSWDGKALESAVTLADLSEEALLYVAYLTQALDAAPLFGTTGPQRDALISWLPGG